MQGEIETPLDDIVNYNVKMTTSGRATTGEVDTSRNKDINSVDAKIITRNETSLADEIDEQKRINRKLTDATTYKAPTTELNSEEEPENN